MISEPEPIDDPLVVADAIVRATLAEACTHPRGAHFVCDVCGQDLREVGYGS